MTLEELNKKYNCFVNIIDFENQKEGKLSGYLTIVKDNICTKDIETTAGSKILKGFIPPLQCYSNTKNKG